MARIDCNCAQEPSAFRVGEGRGGRLGDKTVKWKAVTNEHSDNNIVLPLVKISLASFSYAIT